VEIQGWVLDQNRLYLSRSCLIHFGRAKHLLSRHRNSAERELRPPALERIRLSGSFALPLWKEFGSAGASPSRFGRNSAQRELRPPALEGTRLSGSFALPLWKEFGSAGASPSRFGKNSAQRELRPHALERIRLSGSFALPLWKELGSAGASPSRFGSLRKNPAWYLWEEQFALRCDWIAVPSCDRSALGYTVNLWKSVNFRSVLKSHDAA